MQNFKDAISQIKPTDKSFTEKASEYLDSLVKPPGSLGVLEDTAKILCTIQKTLKPDITKRCIIVAAADNGVVSQGVASAPQSVTFSQTINIAKGITGVGVLAKAFNADIKTIDVGVIGEINHPNVENRKIREGTEDITQKPAMTRDEAETAIQIGFEAAISAIENGYNLLGVGEMGIGNTTTSGAVLAAILDLPKSEIEKVVGRGAGLDDEGYNRKVTAITKAIEMHEPNREDAVDILCKVGGLDIACMTGVYLGSAYKETAIVADGLISTVAALCAVNLSSSSRDYMIFSHQSHERGHVLATKALGAETCLKMNMRLGEGSGCPLMFAVLDGAVAVVKNMATFAQSGISDDYLEGIREIGESAF